MVMVMCVWGWCGSRYGGAADGDVGVVVMWEWW